ncbi:MAG: enoyl-CoA hydratase-related protein [Alphaproteobacteria bacterium]
MTDPRITLTAADGVATMTLDDGKANAFDAELLDGIREALHRLEQDTSVNVLVLRGRPGMLGGGMNLKIIAAGGEPRERMSIAGGKMLQALHDTPLALVLACTGHAVAGAAMLLLVADARVGVDGDFRIGLNEVAAGIRLAPLPIALAEGKLAKPHLMAATAGGRLYSPAQAVEVGYLDRIAPAADYDAALADEVARWRPLDREIFRAVKADVRAAASARLAAILAKQPM